MKTIISFLLYSVVCLGSILYLESIYAIILVTITTVLYGYCLIKGTHPNNRYIRYYKRLKKDLDRYQREYYSGYLCSITAIEKYPKWFREDLKRRLSNIDETYPFVRGFYHYRNKMTSKQIMEHGIGMWGATDFILRHRFISLVIEDLRKERYNDRHL